MVAPAYASRYGLAPFMAPPTAFDRCRALRARLDAVMTADAVWAQTRLDAAEDRLEHGLPADRQLVEVEAKIEASAELLAARTATPLTFHYPEALPVSGHRDEMLALLSTGTAFVLTGETGSGKTTQLPKILLESGRGRRGMIALTQPRRVAALTLSARIREELAAPESAVASSVRFDDRADDRTLVRVMTDGLLLAEAAKDPDFTRYDAIIIDEAHERSVNVDLLLGLVRLARERRPDLALVVSSASIEADRFATWMGAGTPVVRVSGRTFPVDIYHQPPGDDDVGYLDATVRIVRDLHDGGNDGDFLVFLPTERDILEARKRLDGLAGASVLPLFGRLAPHEQQRIFQPVKSGFGRKIVLATNIAETSLTIPGIRVVIDSGLARLKRFNAGTRTERLPVEAVSRASCLQRAGRAGRTAPGICVRLFAEDELARRDEFTTPEILRSNLAGVMLTCLHLGLTDPTVFPWLDAPTPQAWHQARILLEELGAVALAATDGSAGGLRPVLTPLGRTLARIPADPQVARILVAGLTEHVAHEACTIAAFLSVQDPRVRPPGKEAAADAAHRSFAHEAGDLATILRLWERWEEAATNSRRQRLADDLFLGLRRMREWADVRHQQWSTLRETYGGRDLPPHGHAAGAWPLDAVHRAVLTGMLGNVLMWDAAQKSYRAAGNRLLAIHPGSALRQRGDVPKDQPPQAGRAPAKPDHKRGPLPWLVACEVVETGRLFARLCAPIDPLWVIEFAGDRVARRHRDPQWHPQRQQVVVVESVLWKGLPVRDHRMVPFAPIDAPAATAIFLDQALTREEGVASLARRFPMLLDNRRLLDVAKRLRHRARDPSIMVEEEHLTALYRARLITDGVPALLASAEDLSRWIAAHGADKLRFTLADLIDPVLAERADADFPERIRLGGREFPLEWRYLPGDETDGATLDVREDDLARIDPVALDWCVPGWIGETVVTLLGTLPKAQRRELIPLAETAAKLVEAVRPLAGRMALTDALSGALRERHGFSASFDRSVLPAWLNLRLRLSSGEVDGKVVWCGRDRGLFAARSRISADRLRLLRSEWETAPCAGWPGDCPGKTTMNGIDGWIGLGRARTADGSVAVQRTVYPGENSFRAWHDDGLDAALESALAAELAAAATASVPRAMHQVEATLGLRVGAARRELALGAGLEVERGRISDAASFNALLVQARAAVATATPLIDGLLLNVADQVEALRRRFRQGSKSLAAAGLIAGVADECGRLAAPGWTRRVPWSAAQHLDTAMRALAGRLDLAAQQAARAEALHRRAQQIHGLLAESGALDDWRLLACLGLTRNARAAEGQLVLFTVALAQAGAASNHAEGRLRALVDELDRARHAAQARIAQVRAGLHEAGILVGRLAAGKLKDRLVRELAELRLGEFTAGTDLDAQLAAGQALVERVRLAVRGG